MGLDYQGLLLPRILTCTPNRPPLISTITKASLSGHRAPRCTLSIHSSQKYDSVSARPSSLLVVDTLPTTGPRLAPADIRHPWLWDQLIPRPCRMVDTLILRPSAADKAADRALLSRTQIPGFWFTVCHRPQPDHQSVCGCR